MLTGNGSSCLSFNVREDFTLTASVLTVAETLQRHQLPPPDVESAPTRTTCLSLSPHKQYVY
jgi:hypothetical protein